MPSTPLCPRCSRALEILREPAGTRWRCPGCRGESVSLSRVRRGGGDANADALRASVEHATRKGLVCPGCRTRMRAFRLAQDPGLELDACRRCALVWFDRGEWSQMLEASATPPTPEGLRARAKLAEGLLAAQTARVGREFEPVPPEGPGQWLPALFGVPWELEDAEPGSRPWLTWALLALVLATSLVAASHEALARSLALSWERVHEGGIVALVGYVFVHEHWLLLACSLAWWFVFGYDVERVLGRARYAALLAASALGGALAFLALPSSDAQPLAGAGALVSGILVFYALRFPYARLVYLIPGWGWGPLLSRWRTNPWSLQFSARTGLWVWACVQLFGLLDDDRAACVAHLGGAAAGVLFWALARDRARGG